MEQKKIVFLFGGPSAEHEVSVNTAKSALPAFEDQFLLLPVFITKNGKWVLANDAVVPGEAWSIAKQLMEKAGVPPEIALEQIEKSDPFVVFLGLHGEFGEDGSVQALLDAHGLVYTGSDSEASALAMDKPKVLQILQDEEILVPDFLELTYDTTEKDREDFVSYVGLPIVVLPADRGSSVGVTIVHRKEELAEAIDKAKAISPRVLLSQYIPGREVSAGVLVTSATDLTALPPTELIPTPGHEFFDYDAKYTPGATKEVTPPDMPEATLQKIKTVAKKVHQLVNADGYSRTDMIVSSSGDIYVLEINTLPGLTQTSIIPQQAKAIGLDFGQLLTTLCTHVDRTSKGYLTAVSEFPSQSLAE